LFLPMSLSCADSSVGVGLGSELVLSVSAYRIAVKRESRWPQMVSACRLENGVEEAENDGVRGRRTRATDVLPSPNAFAAAPRPRIKQGASVTSRCVAPSSLTVTAVVVRR